MELISRKYTISLLVLMLSAIALCYGLIDSTAWITIIGLVLGLYSAGNVLDKHVSKDK